MAFDIAVAPNPELPGAVNIVVLGDPGTVAAISRIDGSYAAQPVRNFTGIGDTGQEQVVDCEAPLGRAVYYNLTNGYGDILAQSEPVICRPLAFNRALLRSVLMPTVAWMPCEPQDEKNVKWESSTSVHRVVGADTPVVIGEIRQRHSGTMSFLCKSISEADQMVRLMKDGTPLLLRHDPCAQPQTRDILMYVMDVDEVRYGRQGWRLVVADYQSTAFVPGDTLEPEFGDWTFQHLSDSAPDFAILASLWKNFLFQTLLPMPSWVPRTGPAPERAVIDDAW
jgi:hypothetical protein